MGDEAIRADFGEWQREGAKLLGVDRAIVLGMRRELRALGKPVAEKVLAAYGEKMPHRGGLAERITGRARISVLTDLRRGVNVQVANRDGIFMGQFEAGDIRRPIPWITGANGKHPWRPQAVPAGVGAAAFTAEADNMRRDVLNVLGHTIERQL